MFIQDQEPFGSDLPHLIPLIRFLFSIFYYRISVIRHLFKFSRIIEGWYNHDKQPTINETKDEITKINDSLDIDNGFRVEKGDNVLRYLSAEFRFDDCAEYFCFDGEKARDIMQLASDSGKIHTLLELVNRRTTHPTLETYRNKLGNLRHKVWEKAGSTVSDRAMQMSISS